METHLLLWIHAHASPGLDALFGLSHLLGDLPSSAVLVFGIAVWHLARGDRRGALVWAVLALTTLALLEGLKPLVARPRPELWPRLLPQGGFSFPSGHALASATFYPLLAWEFVGHRRSLTAPCVALAVAMPLFIGLGRLYLGVHWPTDVAAGWALGALQSLAAVSWLARGERGDRTPT